MTVLILILVQVLFLSFCLKIIFSLIDRAVAKYRRFSQKDRTWSDMRQVFKKGKRNKNHSKVLKYNSPGLSGLWHQLLIRVQFDIPTAERLINSLRLRHPGKSDRWLIEKAIHDLERDNRR